MEITYQNNQEDFDAYYDYVLLETTNGKKFSRQLFFGRQAWAILVILSITGVFWATLRSEVVGFYLLAFFLTLLEIFVAIESRFRPSNYGRQYFKKIEKGISKKEKEYRLLPRTMKVDENGFEVSSEISLHRYKWQVIDQIVVKSNIIIILLGHSNIYIIPIRSFESEETYREFGKNLLELYECHKGQPIQ
jgi:hypothetical protein